MVTKGIHEGLGMEEYHSWKLDKSKLIEGPISCSMLKSFDGNPYAWLKSGDIKQTDAMRKGSLFDAAVTDPESLSSILPPPSDPELDSVAILPFPDLRSKAAREWKVEKETEGLRVLKQNEFDEIKENHEIDLDKYSEKRSHLDKARDAVFSHPIAGEMLKDASFQVGIIGEVGGVPAKCLLDILPSEDGEYSETIVDYKTISTGLDDESIRKAIGKFKYHWQAAFYRTLFNKVSEDRLCDEFAFIFQDVKTLEVRVVTLGDDSLAMGTRSVGEALKRFLRCSHQGIRSQYGKKVTTLDLMPYHAMSEDEGLAMRSEEGGADE